MLSEWDTQSPDRVGNIFRSMQNITSSHLLDTRLFDFNNIDNSASSPISNEDREEELVFNLQQH